jgi:hypothetical protein
VLGCRCAQQQRAAHQQCPGDRPQHVGSKVELTQWERCVRSQCGAPPSLPERRRVTFTWPSAEALVAARRVTGQRLPERTPGAASHQESSKVLLGPWCCRKVRPTPEGGKPEMSVPTAPPLPSTMSNPQFLREPFSSRPHRTPKTMRRANFHSSLSKRSSSAPRLLCACHRLAGGQTRLVLSRRQCVESS